MLTRRTFLLAAGAAATQLPFAAGAATGRTLDAADVHVADYPTIAAVRWLGDELQRQTQGRLKLRQYHSGQLGREADTLVLVRQGVLAMTRVTVASVNNAFPATRVLSLPYVFDDIAHMRRALDGEVGSRILDSFAARGLVGLTFFDAGVRCIYNRRHPVRAPADLHGLKLRVPPSDMFMELLRAYGVNATPLSYGEVYSALQTHLIDGAENNWPSFQSSRQFEVAPYWSQTEHAYTPDVLLMSAAVLAQLSADDQLLLRTLARQSVAVMRPLWDARVDLARTAAIAGGVKVNDVDHAAFRAAAAPMRDRYLADLELRPLYDAIRASAGVA